MESTAITAINLTDNQLSVISRNADLPSGYKGKEGNVLLAYEFGQRKGLPLLHVIQNMHFINGTPSWKSEYQRAMLNRSGYIKPPVRYKWNNERTACRAVVVLKSDGSVLEGPEVSLDMAQKDGWAKNSKWQTIPEIMLMNRASTFLIRYYFPDVLDGIISTDEAEDIAAMNQPMEYEDKTMPVPEPEIPAEPAPAPKKKSPKMQLWEYVLGLCNGDKKKATDICTAVVGGQTVTKDNLEDLKSDAAGMIAEDNAPVNAEPIPDLDEGN